MTDIPSNLGFGTVKGKFIRATLDSSDPDNDPDGLPLSGMEIVFRPSVSVVTSPNSTPPVTIKVEEITATTDEDGFLIDNQGNTDVNLLETVNEDMSPSGWTWVAEIKDIGKSYPFTLSAGQILDITDMVEVPEDVGSEILSWMAAMNAAIAAVNEVVVDVGPQSDWSGAVLLAQADTKNAYLKRRLTGDVSLTLNSGILNKAYSCSLELQQDGTGGRTITFANVAASEGVVIPLSTAANAVDMVRLEWNGAVWRAYFGGSNLLIPTAWVV